ncbi:MAG: demethoxyubiquinone hydroxylase family protein [Halanaerobiales bacterium]
MFNNKNNSKKQKRNTEGQQYSNGSHSASLLEMLRQNLIGELEAINQYEHHSHMTDNQQARELFQEIADDEKHHVADLLNLITELDEVQANEIKQRVCKKL